MTSIGKYRALQRASTPDGFFTILAIDHQDALRRSLSPDAPEQVSNAALIDFKNQVVRVLIDDASGVLLDPLYGAFQTISKGILGSKGLLVELEKADYQMEPLPLDVEIDPDWNPAKIKTMHADGVKLFFYYNPFEADHAARQESIVSRVAEACAHLQIPFYAEPIVYGAENKIEAVVKSAERIGALGVDVLKLEFPVDVSQEQNQAVWLEACQAITAAIDIPWVLLSAGVSFEMFTQQLKIACQAGASGFIVGRALWGDAAKIRDGGERLYWLQARGRKRLQLLNALVNQYGTSWHAKVKLTSAVNTSTFRSFPNLKDSDDG